MCPPPRTVTSPLLLALSLSLTYRLCPTTDDVGNPLPPSPAEAGHQLVRPDGIDNGAMQVPRRRDAWRWFPPFTRAGEPGQPRAAVRACARQRAYTTRTSEEE